MPTCKTILDDTQRRLHDAATIGDDGLIWSRAELLDWLNDAYRAMLTQSAAVRRLTTLEVPPRFTYTMTQPWEQRHTSNGTHWMWAIKAGNTGFSVSYLFEVEALEGIAGTKSSEGITQQWERAHVNPSHVHYTFALPRQNQRIVKLWYDHKLLVPIATRQLDDLERDWMSLGGEPLAWTPGVGKNRTFDVYAIKTKYIQAYAQPNNPLGIPRRASGSRTYVPVSASDAPGNGWAYTTPGDSDAIINTAAAISTGSEADLGWRVTLEPVSEVFPMHQWEQDHLNGLTLTAGSKALPTYQWERYFDAQEVTFAVGSKRSIESPDRQYLSVEQTRANTPLGKIDKWGSSEDNLLLLEVIGPEVTQLVAEEVPHLLPNQMHKYLRFYVLYRAFNRQGEGYNPNMAGFYEQRFLRGVAFMQRLANITHKDRIYARTASSSNKRPPRVRLPPAFPAVRI